MEEKQVEFISFCIEMYAKKHNKSGTDIEILFEKLNVLEFLVKAYDMLHTQGTNNIIATIEKFLESK